MDGEILPLGHDMFCWYRDCLQFADPPAGGPFGPNTGFGSDYDGLLADAEKLTSQSGEVEIQKLLQRLTLAEMSFVGKKKILQVIKRKTKVPIGDLKKDYEFLGAKATREKLKNERLSQGDKRPEFEAPDPKSEWQPQMEILNSVLGKSSEPEPPMRDMDGFVTAVFVRRVPGLHTLTSKEVNDDNPGETRLPAPEQPLLWRLDERELSEMIERHIAYVAPSPLSGLLGLGPAVNLGLVHLPEPFVKHYLRRRNDQALPTVTAVSTLPLVLDDGMLLSDRGLHRESGIVFRVPHKLTALLPQPKHCNEDAIIEAFKFLTDEWLCDVTADYAGKCITIACALTIIERLLLEERPAFFVTAAQRGGGKTTLLNMVSMAVLGVRAAASAWSNDLEERRKSLFSYLLAGLPFIVWDNLARGTVVSCPSIEKALTSGTYVDRGLGGSKVFQVSSTAIMAFTGNNINPGGDMASRALTTRIEITQPDPENRSFRHQDPIGWTEANRGKILRCLYTVLLGNSRFEDSSAPAETRFKLWWHMIGAPVEQAARLCEPKSEVAFRKLFLMQEAGSETVQGLKSMLELMQQFWPNRKGFTATEVLAKMGMTNNTKEINELLDEADDGERLRVAIEQASGKRIRENSATTLTWQLKGLVGSPVVFGDETFVLHFETSKRTAGEFWVGPIGQG